MDCIYLYSKPFLARKPQHFDHGRAREVELKTKTQPTSAHLAELKRMALEQLEAQARRP